MGAARKRQMLCWRDGTFSKSDGVVWGAATEMEGVCRAPGVQGGLAMLSRLQEGPLSRVLLTGIPAQGGFNAVYLGETLCLQPAFPLVLASASTPIHLDDILSLHSVSALVCE